MSPSVIEKQILTHPAVEDVGVIGLPQGDDGEIPLAFVVLKPEHVLSAEQLIRFTNGKTFVTPFGSK